MENKNGCRQPDAATVWGTNSSQTKLQNHLESDAVIDAGTHHAGAHEALAVKYLSSLLGDRLIDVLFRNETTVQIYAGELKSV